jgi:methionyl-tRNA formyltransferase
MAMGCDVVCDTAELLIQRNVELRTQRSFVQGSEVLRPAPKLTRENTRIDWTRSSAEVWNLVRGLSPYPVAYTELADAGETSDSPDLRFAPSLPQAAPAGPSRSSGHGLQLKIFKVERMETLPEGVGKLEPGRLFTDGKSYLGIATGDGAVSVLDLQLEGKKRMDVRAFLAGFRNPEKHICV